MAGSPASARPRGGAACAQAAPPSVPGRGSGYDHAAGKAAVSPARGAGLARLGLVEADELDEGHRGRVALADAGLEQPGVAALAGGEVRADLGEQAVERLRSEEHTSELQSRV